MKKQHILARIAQPNGIAKIPIAELAGANRVLIENHQGVLAYSLEEIHIKTSYGKIGVIGENLHLLQLNREQLVINGRIDALQLFRR